MSRRRKKQSKQLRQKQYRKKKELKQEQRLSNQLKKLEKEKKELKKLELSAEMKKQAIWFSSWLISPGGTNCSTMISLAKEVSTS